MANKWVYTFKEGNMTMRNPVSYTHLDVYKRQVNAAWNLSRSVKHISNVEDIYKNCDVITIHVPLLDSTKKMIRCV